MTIDNLKSKYQKYITEDDKDKYENSLKTILNQIKQIENLVNEFSDFARMPKPLFRENDLIELLNSNILLLKKIDETIDIILNDNSLSKIIFLSDYEQISRAFFNLIKNSIESIQEKASKSKDFNKKIDIEINKINDYINIIIIDNGLGFVSQNTKDIIKPYYTTKQKGSGLGLSIVNKIINDHNGSIEFKTIQFGAKVEIILPIKNVS